jgi:hypothetical protein
MERSLEASLNISYSQIFYYYNAAWKNIYSVPTAQWCISLKYYSPAHTDSDISVVFEEDDVIHVGDTYVVSDVI